MQTHTSTRGRVLVIFPGALGDLICFGPALRAIARRHNEASVELMAREELARFAVGRIDGVARAHSIDRREIAVLFAGPDHLGSDARAFFDGFSHIYSFFASDDRRFRDSMALAAPSAVLSFNPFRPVDVRHVASAYLDSLEVHDPRKILETRLDLLSQDIEAGCRILTRDHLDAGRFALLAPGSGSPGKNWPAAKFAELARRLASRLPSAIVLGPAEAGMEPIFAAGGHAILESLELGELAAIAAHAALYVGNDSGVSHLAAASGARGLVLFGPTDPTRWRPLGRIRIIHYPSLSDLPVSDVAAAAMDILDDAEPLDTQ